MCKTDEVRVFFCFTLFEETVECVINQSLSLRENLETILHMIDREQEFGRHTPLILEQDTKKICDLAVPARNLQIREGMFFYIF